MSVLFRSDVTAIGDYRAELGETPVWCQRTQSLLWVDILAQRVLRYWPETRKTEIHDLPSVTSAVLMTEKRNLFLLVSQDGIHLYDYENKSRQTLCGYPGAEGTRPNEAAIAPDGSLWFGTLDIKRKKIMAPGIAMKPEPMRLKSCLITWGSPTPWSGMKAKSGLLIRRKTASTLLTHAALIRRKSPASLPAINLRMVQRWRKMGG